MKNCKHSVYSITEKVFKNGSIHLEKRCKECNKHLGYEPQNKPIEESFVLPFGKYKGKTLKFIFDTDFNYLDWLANTEPTSNLKEKIAAYIYKKD
jgi:hypothetical protein